MEFLENQDSYTKSPFLILEFPKNNTFELILKLKDFKISNLTIPKHFKRISAKDKNEEKNQAVICVNEPFENHFKNTKKELIQFLEENKINYLFFVLEIPINEPKTKA